MSIDIKSLLEGQPPLDLTEVLEVLDLFDTACCTYDGPEHPQRTKAARVRVQAAVQVFGKLGGMTLSAVIQLALALRYEQLNTKDFAAARQLLAQSRQCFEQAQILLAHQDDPGGKKAAKIAQELRNIELTLGELAQDEEEQRRQYEDE